MKQKATHDKLHLKAEKRIAAGKQVNSLRKSGLIPGNIYGLKTDSIAVQMQAIDFDKTYKIAKQTNVVYLDLDGVEIPTLVRHVQFHPLLNNHQHVDFMKIDLKKKILTQVPIKIIGTTPAVTQFGGIVLTQQDHLTVEALPENIPQEIEIDISVLQEVGGEYKVSTLLNVTTYTVTDDPEQVIVSIVAHKEESTEVENTVVAPEVITEKPPAEGEEPAKEDKS